MAPPVVDDPARPAQEGLGPVDAITLTFAEPLDVAALAKMLRLELRPLPGVGAARSRVLTGRRLRDQGPGAGVARRHRLVRPPAPRARSRSARGSPCTSASPSTTPRPRSFAEIAVRDRRAVPRHRPRRAAAAACRSPPTAPRYAQGAGARLPRRRWSSSSPPPRPRSPRSTAATSSASPRPSTSSRSSCPAASCRSPGSSPRDTLYRVTLAPARLYRRRRPRCSRCAARARSTSSSRGSTPSCSWRASQGVVERFGAQMVPVEGRGDERVDLRILPVDPLDRSFWPFPERPLEVDESPRPPGPGEEPAPVEPAATRSASGSSSSTSRPSARRRSVAPRRRCRCRARAAPPPSASTSRRTSPTCRARGRPGPTSSASAASTRSSTRSWMRVQVTDLSLTTVEEPDAVRFVVDLALDRRAGRRGDGAGRGPPAAASAWVTLVEGTTGADGVVRLVAARAPTHTTSAALGSWREGRDTLVLDAARPPEAFADNQWSPSYRETGCSGRQGPLAGRGPEAETARPPLHRAAGLPPRGEGPHQGVAALARGRQAQARDRRRSRRRRGARATSSGASRSPRPRRAASTTSSRARSCPPASTPRTFEDTTRERRVGDVAFRMEAYRLPRVRGARSTARTGRRSTASSRSA